MPTFLPFISGLPELHPTSKQLLQEEAEGLKNTSVAEAAACIDLRILYTVVPLTYFHQELQTLTPTVIEEHQLLLIGCKIERLSPNEGYGLLRQMYLLE